MKRPPFLAKLSGIAQHYLDRHPEPKDRNPLANYFFPHTNHCVARDIKVIAESSILNLNAPHIQELQFWLKVSNALSNLSASATHTRLPVISCSSSLLSSVLTVYNLRIQQIIQEFNSSATPQKKLHFIESISTYKPNHPAYSVRGIIYQMTDQIERILGAVKTLSRRSNSMLELSQLNSSSIPSTSKPRSHSVIPLRLPQNNANDGESKIDPGSLTVQTQVLSKTIEAHTP